MVDSKREEAPRFLVKHDGKYYLTVAVLEYDPAEAKTKAEKDGVAEVARYFQPHGGGASFAAAGGAHTPDVEVRAFSSAVAFGQATKNF